MTLTHTEKKKNISFLWIPLIIIILVCLVGWFFKDKGNNSNNNKNSNLKSTQTDYIMSWTTGTKSILAKVEKITFNQNGEVLSMTTYNSYTGTRAIFLRNFANEKGEYRQPGETGGWILKKTSRYSHNGEVWDNKGQKAKLSINKP